jgi:uncharacterized protein (DUF1015 family)
MAEVRAFRGLRYARDRVGTLDAVVCPPYDVISPAQAAALRAASPYNAIHLELPEPSPADADGHSRYARAAAALRNWRAEGVLARDREPLLYAVEESFVWQGELRRHRGVLCVVRLANWDERVVLPHERTLAAPKADRLELLRACETNLSPVFLLQPAVHQAEAALWSAVERTPTLVETRPDEGRVTRVWAVGQDGAPWTAALSDWALYIADGHHRYETALRYRDERRAGGSGAADAGYEYVLAYLVAMDDPGLVVLPTHRCVPAGRIDPARLDALLAERFDVWARPVPGPEPDALGPVLAELRERGAERMTIAIYRPGELLLASPRPDAARWLPPDRAPAWQALDVAQLESLLLQPLLGPQVPEELSYTRDAAEAVRAVVSGQAAFAALLNPTTPRQIAAVADAGERMPQKSTYFYPKPSTGLVFHVLDEDLEGRALN